MARLGVAAAKYWLTKRAVAVVHGALECHGGNGYVEDAPIARIFREAPLNGTWEGAGNVVCLDVLRAMRRDPSCVDALFARRSPRRSSPDGSDRAAGTRSGRCRRRWTWTR